MARTKGCRNLLPEERKKIAKELKDGATYQFLMGKYGLKSDSALRSICNEFGIDYINSPKKKEKEVWKESIDWLSDDGTFQITQGKDVFYLSIVDMVTMFSMFVKKFGEVVERYADGKEQTD